MNFTIVNKCIGLVAKRNSGKSYLLKYLVEREKKEFSKMFVICPTEKINQFYSKNNFIDPKNIYEKYDESFVNKLIDKMTQINQGVKQSELKKVLLILDDCIADVHFHTCESIKKLYARGRHIGISIMITTQYLKSIPPLIRTNTDYMLIGQLNAQGLTILCDEFIKAGMDKKEFCAMYRENTKDYNFLLINNNSTKSDDIDEYYGTLRTPENYVKLNSL